MEVSDATYNVIGQDYNRNRVADRHILQKTLDLLGLPPGSCIADIGAGTGNYANELAGHGYRVYAVEPSETMRRQAVPQDKVSWIGGIAESLPLCDASVDGIIIILAVHHFLDLTKAAREAARVCPAGPLVVLTMDPRESEKFWFNDYFPGIEQHVLDHFPPINEVINIFNAAGRWSCSMTEFPLPHDLADRNMCAGWNRPETYLDPVVRQNTSGFALVQSSDVQRGLELLERDLKSGRWDELNGHLRKKKSFDAGFRFLKFRA